MSRDFTVEKYGELLGAAVEGGYEPHPVRRLLGDGAPAEGLLVLRHDVDRSPRRAREMARLEADRGVTATYYLRERTFSPALARTLAALGHEVGYHYEDFVRAGGDVERAHARFEGNLAAFRSVVDVDTVCMHGNALSPRDNRTMWLAPDAPSFEEYGLLGEAYLSVDFDDVTYYSDTGRTWLDGPLKRKDRALGEVVKGVNVDGTDQLIELLSAGIFQRVCLLVHPSRWAGCYPGLVAGWAADSTINAVKRGLALVA